MCGPRTLEPIPGQPYSFAVHDNFGGVNFGAGAHVRLAGREISLC